MIRLLRVPPEEVRTSTGAPLPHKPAANTNNPEQARAIQGTLFLAFEEFEQDGVELAANALVMKYIRAAHAMVPHLFYYLAPERQFGAIYFFLVAHATPDQIE